MIAAAFMSYAGPFPSEYRDALVAKTWLPQVEALGIPASPAFDFALFLADPSDVRDWNIDGLPADAFSTENGVVVTRGNRWPLLIDPQGQGNKWIKNANPDVVVCNLKMPDFLRKLETAIQFGSAYLLQDVEEELDPAIEPVLNKSIIKIGNRSVIKLGDKEIDYAEDFRFFVTTKLGNPHYTPEVSTKVTIVNFAVKEQGLEAQLLNVVVQKERPDLDKQKKAVRNKAKYKKAAKSEKRKLKASKEERREAESEDEKDLDKEKNSTKEAAKGQCRAAFLLELAFCDVLLEESCSSAVAVR